MKVLLIFFLFLISMGSRAQSTVSTKPATCTVALTLHDTIGAATFDIIQRASEEAAKDHCASVFIRLNTPGGYLQSTRLITEHILSSPIPFLCLISPAGGHAGSAGAIILQACHVTGGLTATNLGAATPILGEGQQMPKDLRNKMVNDTVSWVQGMAELRGRNLEFAKKIVTEAKAVTADEAVKMGALDLATATEKEFLEKAQDRTVLVSDKKKVQVEVGTLKEFPTDIRYQILQFVSEPEWAYLLFMGSLLLLYAEFSHPGLILPGVSGAILLTLSLIAFNKLDAHGGALILMVLGLVFWVAELFITSKGILGIAGTISFILGSFLPFDRTEPGLYIPLRLILTAGFVFGGVSGTLAFLAAKTLSKPHHDFDHQMQSAKSRLMNISEDGLSGRVEIVGEIWNFKSEEPLMIQDEIEVVGRKNLTLFVKKKKG